ncbi:MAG: hypothetical protein WCY21_00665 [Candidatus Cloacimonadaceae bacterium]|jgi:hypothetical protein|nr:hypothetical protein [Candidatus Cloacimonadota bacterium]MDX9949564.1 hypothetical protein [Candidatus Syntrophosphaera sp.]
MKKILMALLIGATLFGCAWVDPMQQIQKSDDFSIKEENVRQAVKNREYMQLYNLISAANIPTQILGMIDRNDRLAIIPAERDSANYADFSHVIHTALSRNLINRGFKVVDLRYKTVEFVSKKTQDQVEDTVDKILVYTVYEGGVLVSRGVGDVKQFAAFQINLEVVNPKTNLLLVSEPIMGVSTNAINFDDYDVFQSIELKKCNPTLPIKGAFPGTFTNEEPGAGPSGFSLPKFP